MASYQYIEKKRIYQHQFTHKRKRYTVYGKTKRECDAKKIEKINRLNNKLSVEKEKITLERYYELWLEEARLVSKESTIYNHEKVWKNVTSALKSQKIVQIEKTDVLKARNEMAKAKSAYSTNRTIRLLRQVFNSAVTDRIIPYNPCEGIKNLKEDHPKAIETIHKALTDKEIKLFIDQSKQIDSFYHNLYLFMLNSGVRIGEALALEWDDIDYENNEIHINKTVSRVSNKEYKILNTPKTENSDRIIPLTDCLFRILIEQSKKNNSRDTIIYTKRIFLSQNGDIPTYNSVNRSIEHIIKQVNKNGNYLRKFTSHCFRDTFATKCIEKGMNPQILKTILGHAELSMTMDLYAQVSPETKKKELGKIIVA